MIKKLFFSLAIASTISVSAQQVQNNGFESWSSGFPASWGSISEMAFNSFGMNPNTEIQTTSAHSGSFAVLMQNQYMAIVSSYIPGEVCTGPMTYSSNGPIRGFQAYSSKPVSFSFWYKFNALSGDQAGVAVYITKWNTGLGKRDTLALGGSLFGLASVYTQTTVPISWINNTLTPDSIQLHFTSSNQQVGGSSQPPAGGQLYLDDVSMTLGVGIETLQADGSFATVYPNPASSFLNITTNNMNAMTAKVYDLTGNQVGTYLLSDKITRVDISGYESGIYIYVVRDEKTGKTFTSRFSVAK